VRVGEFLARPARAAEAGPVPVGPVPVSPVSEPPLHELLLASVPVPVLRSSRERLLGPVREYDTRHNAELLSTLRSFLACDGSWSACAARMYVHVNTVRYRISRIEALTGRDLSALADRVDFFLALRG
jgi:DNA-binding PucR family transcriptional regulator